MYLEQIAHLKIKQIILFLQTFSSPAEIRITKTINQLKMFSVNS